VKHLVKLADQLAREHVLERDRHRCRCCGKDRDLEWAHIITRGARYIRWEPANAVTLCHGDHAYFTGHPRQFRRWIAEELGPNHRDKLLSLEAFFERQGGSVDVEAVIRGFHESKLSSAEMERYRSGAWLG
jgi:hypothetical protein